MKSFNILALSAVVLLSGCASIVKGTEEQVTIVSEENVVIYVDGVKYGTETAIAKVKKGKTHHIKVEKKGCSPVIIETGEKFDVTSLLGILIDFGIISIPIDMMTGAAWKVEPTMYHVTPICEAE